MSIIFVRTKLTTGKTRGGRNYRSVWNNKVWKECEWTYVCIFKDESEFNL
jgi:hypothetical protein